MNFQRNMAISPRAKYENNYRMSRMNILLMLCFTVINTLSTAFGSSFYFLFSAMLPYNFFSTEMFLTGAYPDSYYVENYQVHKSELILDHPIWLLYVAIAVVVISVAAYLACFILSKKQSGWMIAATALFGADCLYMLYLIYTIVVAGQFDFSILIDVAFHAWVMVSLVNGVIAAQKLKTLPPDEIPVTVNEPDAAGGIPEIQTDVSEAPEDDSAQTSGEAQDESKTE